MRPQSLTQALMEQLPEASWPWVIAALRQDNTIWQSLQDAELLKQTRQRAENVPECWSPAQVGLAALHAPLSLGSLRVSPLGPLPEKWRNQAAYAYEQLALAKLETPLSLEDATLLALSLRERRRALGSWDKLVSDLSITSTDNWPTPLACLYGLLPNPNEMLAVLLAPDAGSEYHTLALHALLSNPTPPQQQIEALFGLLSTLANEARLAILGQLSAQRPELARQLAERFIGVEGDTSSQTQDLNKVGALLQQAEYHRLSGQHAKAISLLQAAWETSHHIQADLASHFAQSAAAEEPELALTILEQAAQTAPDSKEIATQLAMAKAKVGQPAEAVEQLGAIPSTVFDGASPAAMLAGAQLAQQAKDKGKAQTIARQLLEVIRDDPKALTANAAHLLPLAEMFLTIDLPADAIQTAELGLSIQPNDVTLIDCLSAAQLETGQLDAAIETANLAVALSPQKLDLRRRLTQALVNAEGWQAALDQLQTFESLDGEILSTDLHAKALCELRLNQPRQAAQTCQQAIHLDSQDGHAHAQLGEALTQLGDRQTALEHYQEATRLQPDMPEPWLALAEHDEQSGETEAALSTLQKGIAAAPSVPELHFAFGRILQEGGQAQKALPSFKKAAKLLAESQGAGGEQHRRITLQIGKTLHQLEQYSEARQTLEQAHQVYPSDVEIAHAYAKTLLEMGDAQGALAALAVPVQAKSAQPEVYMDYARAHLAWGQQPQEAVAALASVLKHDPGNAEALALKAEALASSGDFPAAVEDYQQAMETELAADPAWFTQLSLGLGRAAKKIGQSEIAIAALQEAHSASQDNVEVLQALSEAYHLAGLARDAYQTAEKALENSPESPAALLWFANQAYQLEHPDEALNALEQAAKLAPESADILLRLGHTSLQIGQLERAESAYKKLLKVEAATASDLRTAAQVLREHEREATAIQLLEHAAEVSKHGDPKVLQDLAAAYQTSGDQVAAHTALAKLTKIAPNDPHAHRAEAKVLLALDRPQAALASLQRALELDPGDAQLHYQAAEVLLGCNDLAAALEHAEMALQLSPDDASRILAARIAWEGLRQAHAWELLEGVTSVPNNVESACLRAEVALAPAVNEEIEAAQSIADISEGDSFNINPAVLALNARLAARRNDMQEAARLLGEALEHFNQVREEYKQAYLLPLAEAALELQNWEQALALSEQAVEVAALQPRPQYTLGRVLLARAEYHRLCQTVEATAHALDNAVTGQEAYQTFQQAVQAALRGTPFPDSQQQVRNLAVDGQDAFEGEFQQETAHSPAKSPMALVKLALAMVDEDPAAALESVTAAIEARPTCPLLYALGARIAYHIGEPAIALQHLQKALAIWDDEPNWQSLAGQLQLELGQGQAAVHSLQRAIEMEPKQPSLYVLLAKAHSANGGAEKAIKSLEQANGLKPDDLEITLDLAQAYHRSGQSRKAIQYADQAIKAAPKGLAPLLLRSQIALQSGDAKEALKYAKSALRIKASDRQALVTFSHALLALGQRDEALEVLSKAAEHSNDPLPLLLERAALLAQVKGAPARLEALQKLADDYSEEPQVLVSLAEELSQAGMLDEAIQAAQRAIRASSETAAAHTQAEQYYLLGKLLHQAGQLDQAVHQLEKAIQANPAFVEPYLEISQVLTARRQHEQTLLYLQKATEIAPHDARPYQQAGLALKEGKDYQAAERMLKRAAALAPQDLTVQRQLAAVVALNLIHHPVEAMSKP